MTVPCPWTEYSKLVGLYMNDWLNKLAIGAVSFIGRIVGFFVMIFVIIQAVEWVHYIVHVSQRVGGI